MATRLKVRIRSGFKRPATVAHSSSAAQGFALTVDKSALKVRPYFRKRIMLNLFRKNRVLDVIEAIEQTQAVIEFDI